MKPVSREVLAAAARRLLRIPVSARQRADPAYVRAIHGLQEELGLAPHCRECGCTEARACMCGCAWAEPDLCTNCV